MIFDLLSLCAQTQIYAQNLILVNFFGFLVKRFCHVSEVSGLCRGPGRVGTGPGDVFTRVLTDFHRERVAAFRVMSQKLFKLTSIKLMSIKFRVYQCFVVLFVCYIHAMCAFSFLCVLFVSFVCFLCVSLFDQLPKDSPNIIGIQQKGG